MRGRQARPCGTIDSIDAARCADTHSTRKLHQTCVRSRKQGPAHRMVRWLPAGTVRSELLAATLVAPSHKQVLLVSSYSTMGRRRCLASVEQQGAGTVKRSEQRIRIVTHGDTRWQRRGKLERKSERKRERKKRGKGVQTSALPNLLVATVFILRPNKSSQLSLRNGLTQHQSIESACRGAPRGDI